MGDGASIQYPQSRMLARYVYASVSSCLNIRDGIYVCYLYPFPDLCRCMYGQPHTHTLNPSPPMLHTQVSGMWFCASSIARAGLRRHRPFVFHCHGFLQRSAGRSLALSPSLSPPSRSSSQIFSCLFPCLSFPLHLARAPLLSHARTHTDRTSQHTPTRRCWRIQLRAQKGAWSQHMARGAWGGLPRYAYTRIDG